ncbi:uncharacterized protein LOC116212358 [Punica granatum]|uniref:Uncharacterized protein n=2 Tax=Punica granatum TaxID=22663 RepID=A0A218W790_PUNGR|nr:uncharacterized protein LOC116212358 [Punica granatum]XP_031402781.1 uncharacterized protein LOC116212358 [Punica granatum]XP_031402782.1 uncharacterized protein LOC116212358 [Punica granatum]OWM68359.1 hypothetical protein CDL15_Pgr004841 [Punica granatum]PKI57079.1 hypothetical protein CRG98_022583 [Punica granatum]
MQDPNMPFREEILNIKPRKKTSKQKNSLVQLQGVDSPGFHPEQGTPSLKPRQKAKPSKRNLKNEVSPLQQQQSERSNSDSLPDSSPSGNEYRALRRKYLLLEEESCALGNELRDIENEVRSLEDEKFALLDHLVVLEGLIDPSELQPLETQ